MTFQIAKTVVLKEFQTDRTYLTRLASALIERLDLSNNLSILIHPDDRDSISQMRSGITEQLDGVKYVHIEVSNTVHRGGCKVESDRGVLVT